MLPSYVSCFLYFLYSANSSSINVDSFLYCCPSHLLDRGFCTLIPEPELDSIKPSEDDIAGVVKEYQEREQKKAKKDDKGDGKESDAKAKDKKPASPSVASPPPKTRPQKYALHREIFQIVSYSPAPGS